MSHGGGGQKRAKTCLNGLNCQFDAYLFSHKTVTVLEQLTYETLSNLGNNSTFDATEEKIWTFFTEDAIIERTRDCKAYFEKYISARAMERRNTNVSFFHIFKNIKLI